MISFRTSMTLPLFALLAAVAGCSGESATGTGTESARVETAVTEQPAVTPEGQPAGFARHRGGPQGGPDFLLVAALHEPINLTATQKTAIEGALTSRAPKAPPVVDSARTTALAAAIRSGNVDGVGHPAPSESDKAARLTASAAALDTLHKTLTKEQRIALVDAVSKRMGEHSMGAPKDGPKPEGRGFRHGNKEGAEHGPRGPMGMLEGINLTDAQKAALKTKLDAQRPAPPTAEQREAMKKQFESFRTDMAAKLSLIHI